MTELEHKKMRAAVTELTSAGIENARQEAGWLSEYCMRLSGGDSDLYIAEFDACMRRRVSREPLQYILGEWEFYGLRFSVGPGVLIPRVETEILAERAALLLEKGRYDLLIDLCSGTGTIAVTLAKTCGISRVAAVEIDDVAVHYLRRNIIINGVENKVTVVHADALNPFLPKSYVFEGAENVLITANPPYVSEEEYAELAPELFWEPRGALVANDGGLLFFKSILNVWAAGNIFKRMPTILFEIGETQGAAVRELAMAAGYSDVRVLPDYAGLDRVVQIM